MKRFFQLLLASVLAFAAGFSNAQSASNVVISAGQSMEPGKFYYSPNGQYFVVFQPGDGNLVVYKGSGIPQNAVWNSGARYGTVAILQGDENFVVYKGSINSANAVWHTHTNSKSTGSHTPVVRLDDTGKLTVSGYAGTTLWASRVDYVPPTPCVPTPYAACIRTGFTSYGTWIMACSYAEAQQNAFMSGATLGMCP